MSPKGAPRKEYIGDGVYVEYDGYDIILTTENGISVTNRIVLEPAVMAALELFVHTLRTRGEWIRA